ncbi:uncharacterized protein I206_106635 [Kwoniella pini CBS 10737]|uniref:Uncharacterized protein n=1 Tax=Kwoniella pini CBS 10737 TaxID=1296096 RepID=A0AAJ8LB97_9TREE
MSEDPAYLSSASALIKSLKGPADPPQPGSLLKIDIAISAWRRSSFHIPRKADVLRDWIVESWARTHRGYVKAALISLTSSPSPLAELSYHDLLLETSASCDSPAQAPLQILSSFFIALTSSDNQDKLIEAGAKSMRILFPTQSLTHKAEAWADIWALILRSLSKIAPTASIEPLLALVSTGITDSVISATNSKKVSATIAVPC